MLTNPRNPWQVRIPGWVKMCLLAPLIGGLAYTLVFFGSSPVATEPPPPEFGTTVRVPDIDAKIVARAQDATREQRLLIEPEPLRHLLEQAIDVTPPVALALGMPGEPIPVAEVRDRRDELRGRWLWYRGELEDLTGPGEGHPIKGYSIYEATVRLPNGEHAIGEFSLPPPADVRRGGIVRIQGFLMKLRDKNYPFDVHEAPWLVGREIQLDYLQWGPVTELDTGLLAEVDDTDLFPGSKIWQDVEEDQTTPLWHLAAYARDTAAEKTLEDWRQYPVLNAAEIHPKLKEREIAPGTPMRVLGTLMKRRSIAAPPNPAGVEYWTEAYIQSQDYAGVIVPVWVPKRLADMPLRTDLEVRGYYYRRYAYESIDGVKRWAPLFIAADLDRYDLHTGETMTAIGFIVAPAFLAM
ncbi:MAG: hypothetical protein KDE27_21845, partial [Planctomycetes bacterium]|nr:hypothetical protein [Planctomycetota bacterium]